MIHAVLFDLDNTLVDFLRMKSEAIKAAVSSMVDAGLNMDLETASASITKIYREEGIEHQEIFDMFLERHYDTIDHKILAAGVVAYRKAKEASLVLYPHVTATLTGLIKQGIKLAILTDAPVKQAWLRLCYLNLHHLFDIVIPPDDSSGAIKPSPLPFRLALEKLNVKASEALMVGDWPERDMVGAKKVGIRTVFAKYGDSHDTIESGADYEIDDISELMSIIESLRKGDPNKPRA